MSDLTVAHMGYIFKRVYLDGECMAKTATVRARVEPRLKEAAEEVLERLGLNPTSAITMYYEQIVRRRGIPFDVSLPNAMTRAAMLEAETGAGVVRAKNVEEMFARLDADD